MVKCNAPFIMHSAAVAMKAAGIDCCELPDNTCCSFPIPFRQDSDEERMEIRKKMVDTADGRKIYTLCPGCAVEMQEAEADAEHIVFELSRRADSLPKLKRPLKIAVEPGCHSPDMSEEMIKIVKGVGGEYIGNKTGCCGKWIPRISEELMNQREEEIKGADIVVVACVACFLKYDSYPDGVPVVHISELVSMAAGDSESLKYHKIKFNF